jgi:hypothetical protein
MPLILATQEGEIRKMWFEACISKKNLIRFLLYQWLAFVVYICYLSYMGSMIKKIRAQTTRAIK